MTKSKRLLNLLKIFNHKCVFCHCDIVSSKFAPDNAKLSSRYISWTDDNKNHYKVMRATIDHLIPKSIGGGNRLENLVPACFECNQKKNNKLKDVTRASLLINAILA